MKIKCLHGYFIFEELKPGQASEFMSLFGLDLVLKDGYYTFDFLSDAPDYAIEGGTYLGAPVTTTFEGLPWEIMRENSLVYDFNQGLVVALSSVTTAFNLSLAGNYFISNGMLLPGSLTDTGDRVKDYSAFFLRESVKFKYSEVGYE